MQELKRIINYKRIILLLIAVTVNVVFFLYDNKPVMDEDIINKENVAHETYIKNYHEEVNAIIDNADKLKKYSIFNKAGSFSYANILQTARDFERVKNVILPEDEYKGVQAYTTYYYQYFFTMLVMMFVIYDMFAQRGFSSLICLQTRHSLNAKRRCSMQCLILRKNMVRMR